MFRETTDEHFFDEAYRSLETESRYEESRREEDYKNNR